MPPTLAPHVNVREPGFVYTRHRPSGATGHVVRDYWTMRAARCRTAVESALPSAAVELYFNLGPAGRHVVDGAVPRRLAQRRAWVLGPRAAPLRIAKETADCDIVGIALRPGVAPLVLGIPACELRGRMVDLDLLWNDVPEILERLHAAPGPGERAAVLELALARRIAAARDACEPYGPASVALVERLERGSIADVAGRLGIAHRTLIRILHHHVGLNPKTFQRVERLRRLLETVSVGCRRSWAMRALEAGFCDQSHMIHEFRRLTGLTPAEYEARRSAVGVGFVRVLSAREVDARMYNPPARSPSTFGR